MSEYDDEYKLSVVSKQSKHETSAFAEKLSKKSTPSSSQVPEFCSNIFWGGAQKWGWGTGKGVRIQVLTNKEPVDPIVFVHFRYIEDLGLMYEYMYRLSLLFCGCCCFGCCCYKICFWASFFFFCVCGDVENDSFFITVFQACLCIRDFPEVWHIGSFCFGQFYLDFFTAVLVRSCGLIVL